MVRRRCAFSLLELLIALTVIGVLIALSAPALSGLAGLRLKTICVNNLRQAGVLLSTYAADHRDMLPSCGENVWQLELPPASSDSRRRTWMVGGARGFDIGSWSMLFPDEWSRSVFSRGLQCPGTPVFGSPSEIEYVQWGGSVASFNRRRFPQYYLSEAIGYDPGCLAPGFEGMPRGRLNRWADIAFPSQKAVLYESTAFCLPTPEQRAWALRWGATYMWPSSVLAGDGSVTRRPIAEALSLGPGGVDFNFTYRTVNGIYGRDW